MGSSSGTNFVGCVAAGQFASLASEKFRRRGFLALRRKKVGRGSKIVEKKKKEKSGMNVEGNSERLDVHVGLNVMGVTRGKGDVRSSVRETRSLKFCHSTPRTRLFACIFRRVRTHIRLNTNLLRLFRFFFRRVKYRAPESLPRLTSAM